MKPPSVKASVITTVGVLGSIASLVALFASGPEPQSPPVQLPSTPESTEPAKLPIPPVSNLLFSEARELLLRQGWFPMSSPVNPTANPNVQSGNGPYFVDQGYRELITCSGSGLAPCRFGYRSAAGQYLYVVTVGEDQYARVNDLWVTEKPDP